MGNKSGGKASPRALVGQGRANRERIIVVAEHVEFKKDSNAAGKTEEAQELDDLDQEIAF